MDINDECNKMLKTASCLVRVIGDNKPVALVRIGELRQTLDNLEKYIKEQENGTQN